MKTVYISDEDLENSQDFYNKISDLARVEMLSLHEAKVRKPLEDKISNQKETIKTLQRQFNKVRDEYHLINRLKGSYDNKTKLGLSELHVAELAEKNKSLKEEFEGLKVEVQNLEIELKVKTDIIEGTNAYYKEKLKEERQKVIAELEEWVEKASNNYISKFDINGQDAFELNELREDAVCLYKENQQLKQRIDELEALQPKLNFGEEFYYIEYGVVKSKKLSDYSVTLLSGKTSILYWLRYDEYIAEEDTFKTEEEALAELERRNKNQTK